MYANQIFDRMSGMIIDADQHYLKNQTVHLTHEKVTDFSKDFLILVEKTAFNLQYNVKNTYIKMFDA